MYLALGVLSFFENFLPPLPADAAVAVGAFLSHEGLTAPVPVFLVVWLTNVAGATAVYYLSRYAGRAFFESRLGRRLLAPGALAVIERDYLRYGAIGIFIARFLPGIRAVVPPFAGLVGIPVWRSIPPLALASGIWYGAVTAVGAYLGTEWDRIAVLLGDLNRAFAIVGLLVATAVAIVLWVRRRRREDPVLAAARAALGSPEGELPASVDPRAAARLLLELAYAERGLTVAQREAVEAHLRARWGLEAPGTVPERHAPGRLRQLGERLRGQFGEAQRLALVEQMWQSAFAGGTLDPEAEEWLMRRAGELLELGPDEVSAVRERLRGA